MDLDHHSESAQAKMFAMLFGDIDAQINRLSSLKSELPAAISKDINDAIERSTDSIHQLAQLVETIRPGVEKAIALQTNSLAAQVGTMVKAAEGMNEKANDLIQKKTASIETIIKNQVETAIQQSLSSKITNELSELNRKLNEAGKRVEKIAAAAEMSSRGNVKKWLASLCVAGIIGGLAAGSMISYAMKNGMYPMSYFIDYKAVSEKIIENFYIAPRK